MKESFFIKPIGFYSTNHQQMEEKTCSKCNQTKTIKAKGLCNTCYTAECRRKAKEKENEIKESEKVQELEVKLRETMEALSKQLEANVTLVKELNFMKEDQTSLKEATKEGLSPKEGEASPKPTRDNVSSPKTPDGTNKDLSTRFIEELQNQTFDYDKEKYKTYLEEASKKKKWKSMVRRNWSPCFLAFHF